MISTFLALSLIVSPLQAPSAPAVIPSPTIATELSTQVLADISAPSNDFVGVPGYQQDTYSFELTPGSGTVGVRWADRSRATWGSSYATSTETLLLYYEGKARAAGNVYLNQRIVQVCIWYTRNSVAVSSTVCSNARSTSTAWTSGPEVTTSAWDSLGLNDPKTVFNISTVRISPTIF